MTALPILSLRERLLPPYQGPRILLPLIKESGDGERRRGDSSPTLLRGRGDEERRSGRFFSLLLKGPGASSPPLSRGAGGDSHEYFRDS